MKKKRNGIFKTIQLKAAQKYLNWYIGRHYKKGGTLTDSRLIQFSRKIESICLE